MLLLLLWLFCERTDTLCVLKETTFVLPVGRLYLFVPCADAMVWRTLYRLMLSIGVWFVFI